MIATCKTTMVAVVREAAAAKVVAAVEVAVQLGPRGRFVTSVS